MTRGPLADPKLPTELETPESLSRHLEEARPEEILRWAWESFRPAVALTSSFQTQSVPLLHLVSRVAPEMPVLFLDTGFHFQETLAFRDHLVELLGLALKVMTAREGPQGFRRRYGLLYRSDPDLCCYLNKVEPMNLAQAELRAWVTGIRRDQTAHRSETKVVSKLSNGTLKICPIARWTSNDVREYIARYDLPEHPLASKGFRSIGCAPCTRAVSDDEGEREGRWSGKGKTECGLHLEPGDRGAER